MVSKTIAGARQNIRERKTSGQILTINKYRKNVLSIFIYIYTYIYIYFFFLNIWPLVFLYRIFCLAPAIVLLIIFSKFGLGKKTLISNENLYKNAGSTQK